MLPLLAFFGFTFLASWTLFRVAAALTAGAYYEINPIFLLGVFAPAWVALALTAWFEGRDGVRALLARIFHAPSNARWYVFAVSYMAVIKLTTALLLRVFTGEWPKFGDEPVFILPFAILLSTPVQAGEEIGWRGYALPRLAKYLGLPGGSIVLGIIWASWHLPLFFIPDVDKTNQSFPVYLLSVTAISVTMAWLYWRTRASLLLTMLLHASVNNTTNIVPSALPGAVDPLSFVASRTAWVSVVLLWICAAYFLVQMRGATLPDYEVQPDAVGSRVS
jgi:membrane protease YdiL (CAAX protease family)